MCSESHRQPIVQQGKLGLCFSAEMGKPPLGWREAAGLIRLANAAPTEPDSAANPLPDGHFRRDSLDILDYLGKLAAIRLQSPRFLLESRAYRLGNSLIWVV